MRLSPSIAIFLALTSAQAAAQRIVEPPRTRASSAFAVILDPATWAAAEAQVRAYCRAVEADGLATWIAVDDWKRPDDVRALLRELHAGDPPLEGALLVGRIPVAMLRDAQHLTSAFKMHQERYPLRRSSVPSDRFYEDFDLSFEYLSQEAEEPWLHYYSLRPESAQRVEKELYTARLVAPVEGEAAHAMIRACLERFAAAKRSEHTLDRALAFMGHGYLSESLDAWSGTLHSLREQLPVLFRPGGRLKCYHHSMDAGLKAMLLRELRDTRLDLAMLHHHGGDDTQYLLGAPPLPSVTAQIEAVRLHLRTRLRTARRREKNEAEAQLALMERFGVPMEWFAKAFDEEQIRIDEELAAEQDIFAKDLEGFACGAEVVMFDSCFNGSFIERPYIAGQYLRGSGETLVCVANSVNVAQDVWADRHLERLGSGARLGQWHRLRPHLESHLFGDPTFRFSGGRAKPIGREMFTAKEDVIRDALRRLRGERSPVQRLEALAELASMRCEALNSVLIATAADPHERVRRLAAELMGDIGREEYIETLVHAVVRDPSERVGFSAREAIRKFDPAVVRRVAEPILAAEDALRADSEWRARIGRAIAPSSWTAEDLVKAGNRELEVKKRINAMRSFRLYRVHAAVDVLCAIAARPDDDPTVRRTALEVLGWFVYYEGRDRILAACQAIRDQEGVSPAVSAEALKTANRIRAGANDPLLP